MSKRIEETRQPEKAVFVFMQTNYTKNIYLFYKRMILDFT